MSAPDQPELTREQFEQMFGPSATDIPGLMDTLRQSGANIIGVRPSNGQPGRSIRLEDLNDGDCIGDNDTVCLF